MDMIYAKRVLRSEGFYEKFWLSIKEMATREDGTRETLLRRMLIYAVGLMLCAIASVLYPLIYVVAVLVLLPIAWVVSLVRHIRQLWKTLY